MSGSRGGEREREGERRERERERESEREREEREERERRRRERGGGGAAAVCKRRRKEKNSIAVPLLPSTTFPLFPPSNHLFLFRFYLTMAVGKNKRVSKRGKGGRKKAYVMLGREERSSSGESGAISMRRRRRRPAGLRQKKSSFPFACQSPYRRFAPAALIGDAQGFALCSLWRTPERRLADGGA